MTQSEQQVNSAPSGVATRIKNIALFLVSPFIGLVYAVLLPGKLLQLALAERKASAQDAAAKLR